MEEIRTVDHRAFFSVYETDRNSKELLAKTYQVIAEHVPQFPGQSSRVLDVVSTKQKSACFISKVAVGSFSSACPLATTTRFSSKMGLLKTTKSRKAT